MLLARLWSTPALLLAIATLFWSGNFVIGRAVHELVPPVALSFWRWSGAFVIVLGFAWPHLRRDWPALRRQWPLVTLLAFLGVATFNALVYWGLNTTTVINAVLLQSTMPVLILIGSWALFGERVGLLQVLALLASMVGVGVIVSGGSLDRLLHLRLLPGDAVIVLAVIFYALYSVLLRRRPQVHPLSFLAASFALGALMLLPVFVWEHLTLRQVVLEPAAMAALGYVVIFPSLLAYLCFNRGVELMGANRAGQFLHLMPVYGSALAAVFLGESLHGYHVAGAAMIALGIVMARRAQAPKP
jgi:drug/metabolite transporter (DMT)-like permease